MHWKKSNAIRQGYNLMFHWYRQWSKEYKNYRCKIIGINEDDKTKRIIIWVRIGGVKSQLIRYFPGELVINESMLIDFSTFDVRAITFYALMEEKYASQHSPKYCIKGQEFQNGKTIFIINGEKKESEERKSAQELYKNWKLLSQFNQIDLVNIVSTAIQEQTLDDLTIEE